MYINDVALIFVALSVLPFVAIIVVYLLQLLVSFVLRTELKWGDKFCDYIAIVDYNGLNPPVPIQYIMVAFAGVILTFVTFIGILRDGLGIYELSPYWTILPVVPFVARWVVDVCRGLKINHKTGDSVRIAALEEEIRKIKGD